MTLRSWKTQQEESKLSRCERFQGIPSPAHQPAGGNGGHGNRVSSCFQWNSKIPSESQIPVVTMNPKGPQPPRVPIFTVLSVSNSLHVCPSLLETSQMSSVSCIKPLSICLFPLVPKQPTMMRLNSYTDLGLVVGLLFWGGGKFN